MMMTVFRLASTPLVRQLALVALCTMAILLLPLAAMQFTREVDWQANDFVAAAVLLGGAGTVYVLAARLLRTGRQRLLAAALCALALLLAWAELAVGVFGTPLAGS
ncbi:hypothetical protein ACLB1G_17500 [Oxalobacteraceae bacterium A2-2]